MIFIPIPLPEQVIRTSSCTISLYTPVIQTVLGLGMDMNVTAHTWRCRCCPVNESHVNALSAYFLPSTRRKGEISCLFLLGGNQQLHPCGACLAFQRRSLPPLSLPLPSLLLSSALSLTLPTIFIPRFLPLCFVTGFQMGSGQTGLSQKSHIVHVVILCLSEHMLPPFAICCNILSHFAHSSP